MKNNFTKLMANLMYLHNHLLFQTFDEAERNHWKCMENEWEQQKLKILNSLLGSDRDSFDFPADVIVRLLYFILRIIK